MTTASALEAFFEESITHLEVIESSLLELEKKSGDLSLVDELFRAVHSMKGNAGLVGLGGIHSIATEMESALEEIRNGGGEVDGKARDALFKQLDTLQSLVTQAQSPGKMKPKENTAKSVDAAGPAVPEEGMHGEPRTGLFLAFMLGRERYGMDISYVREIILMKNITRVPNAKPYLAGIMNLRGMVIPVIDARRKLDFTASEDACENIIIVENKGLYTGVMVDTVQDIVSLDKNDITPVSGYMSRAGSDFILDVGVGAGGSLLLLDMERFCAADETFF